MQNKLKPCPFCGGEVEICGGPEDWTPTWYDPDSGGDPYYIACDCGCAFEIGYCEAQNIAEAWNRRAPEIVKVETSFYDKEEIHENCTVQVLTNTKTGEVSVGWWENEID